MVTTRQIGLLHHTLGLNERTREPYRNHFVVGPGHHDMPDLLALEAAGLMERARRPGFLDGGDIVFRVTDAGIARALAALPAPRKRSRYEEYLDADGCAGDSFGEFLCGSRLPEFEQCGGWRDRQYRMYRRTRGGWDRDVQGEWRATKKEAKASYKAALQAYNENLRAALVGGVA